MTKELKIEKLNPEARISVAEGDSPLLNIYPCLENEFLVIPAGTTVAVPTGLKITPESGYCVLAKETPELAKRGIAVLGGIITPSSECKLMLSNTTINSVVLDTRTEVAYKASGLGTIIIPASNPIANLLVIPVVAPVIKYSE